MPCSDSFLTSAPLASIQPHSQSVRLPCSSSNGTATDFSLEVVFPTSYGRYRAEDLELENDRLKVINEEGEECESDKAKGVC